MGALSLDERLSASEVVEELRSFRYGVNLLLLFSVVSCVVFEVLNSLQACLMLRRAIDCSLKPATRFSYVCRGNNVSSTSVATWFLWCHLRPISPQISVCMICTVVSYNRSFQFSPTLALKQDKLAVALAVPNLLVAVTEYTPESLSSTCEIRRDT